MKSKKNEYVKYYGKILPRREAEALNDIKEHTYFEEMPEFTVEDKRVVTLKHDTEEIYDLEPTVRSYARNHTV
ncbi:MAG: hypothetical protein GWO20_05870 [Candidatus Korarchaeota archaeon]|nr:hypothetical protein [Candidatus Korarchaeota archaeon]NIU84784.1 hypothetical protein [Candidatus Thorarchaeota archaeon]NIW14778.1 hypothetical protein [Candidatus Thorarchaeota archaeon]NIW51508.1 hypothetical protein [Candidatus Korarchaeota archaeon]